MSKRFQPPKEFGRSTKKAKLDITISKERPNNGRLQRQSLALTVDTNVNKNKDAVAKKHSYQNLWDDDDDAILLATQVAETQQAAATKINSLIELTDSEVSFGEFAGNIQRTTSTQQPKPNEDYLFKLFDDDDDFDVLVAAVSDNELPAKQTKIVAQEPESKVNPFKVPATPTISASLKKPETLKPKQNFLEDDIAQSQTIFGTSSDSAARRQLASEKQIKFLKDHVENLKKENAKLTKEITNSKVLMETKNGEISILRDELRQIKKQIQTLKMEKLVSTEAAKTECKTKIAELSKQVQAKETELQLKSVEYSVLKMRHADETKRFETSMRDSTINLGIDAESSITTSIRKAKKCNLMRMHNLHHIDELQVDSAIPEVAKINEHIFIQPDEADANRKQRNVFIQELKNLQTIVAQLLLHENRYLNTEDHLHMYIETILCSTCKVFGEFWTYVHNLEFRRIGRVHPYHNYNVLNDVRDSNLDNLQQPDLLYRGERAVSLRRFLVTLGAVCQKVPYLGRRILTRQEGNYFLMQIAAEAIHKLSFSREICVHFGLVEAFATLVHSLLVNLSNSEEDARYIEMLVDVLKQIIFMRPSAYIFREVSYSMLECTRLPNAMALFCKNSKAESFYADRVGSFYRFSNDSCLLQVYAGLIEIIFPMSTRLSTNHFKLLTVICGNHMHFLYKCFANPPHFIHNMLPPYDDEDDNYEDLDNDSASTTHKVGNSSTHSSSSSSKCSEILKRNSNLAAELEKRDAISCQCYTKLCLSGVTMIFQLLRQWIITGKLIETSNVAKISKISVQLLHIIFCDNYLVRLFRDAEETTRHHLKLISKWWCDNQNLLQLNKRHMNFLKKLQNFHVMPKEMSDEANITNINADINEWYRASTDDRNYKELKPTDITKSVNKLHLLQDASDANNYFVGIEGNAYNFD